MPFGPRQVTGYVLEQVNLDSCPTDRRLKDIIRPLDDEPLFGPEMVSLFRFISRYYHYPLGLVIAEALPAGLKVMSHKTVRLTEAGIMALSAFSPEDEAGFQAEALKLLNRPNGLTLARLNREKPGAGALVPRLEAKGWVTVETGLNRGPGQGPHPKDGCPWPTKSRPRPAAWASGKRNYWNCSRKKARNRYRP